MSRITMDELQRNSGQALQISDKNGSRIWVGNPREKAKELFDLYGYVQVTGQELEDCREEDACHSKDGLVGYELYINTP